MPASPMPGSYGASVIDCPISVARWTSAPGRRCSERLLSAGFTDVVGIRTLRRPHTIGQTGHSSTYPLGDVLRPRRLRRFGQFSLITCFQTIEHVIDPLLLCRSADHLLKPGGAFFLIGHNRRAMSARLWD